MNLLKVNFIVIIIILILIYMFYNKMVKERFQQQHIYNPDELFTHLKFISRLLKNNNIKHWLIYGSLLGAVREHDIISYDYDFDLAAYIEDVDSILDLNKIIQKDGYEFKKLYLNDDTNKKIWRVSLKVFYNNIEMGDIYLYTKFKDGFMRRFYVNDGIYFWPKSTFPSWFIEELDTIKVRDEVFHIPRNPEILLEYWYGKTWKIPIKAKAQGGQGDDNSDYYGGAINMKLKNLIDYLKTKNIFLQPIIDKKIEIIVPSDQENWIYENEKIKTI